VPNRIYEVTTPEGVRIMHTGDTQHSQWIPQAGSVPVDIMLINGWINESGGSSATDGMINAVTRAKPRFMIPGHYARFAGGSTHTRTVWSYPAAMAVPAGLPAEIDTEVEILLWGERFDYAGPEPRLPPQAVGLPDINGDTYPDLAVLRDGSITTEIRDGQFGLLQRVITFLDNTFSAIGFAALPDSDGNGVAELAVLATRNSDGRIVAEIRNITGAEAPRFVWFAANHTPMTIKVIEGDADSNGVVELAVLSTRDSDGRIAVEVKNAFGPTNPNTVWYMSGNTPVDLEIVPDKDANGVPELAVLSFRNSDGRIVTEVKNAVGATNPTAVWFMPGNTAIDLVAVDDKDSNGIPEVAVLSSRNSDGRNVVEIKNASGPTAPTTVWFMAGNTATDVAQIHDADSNGVTEVAVLSVRDSDGRIVVEVKNVTGPTSPNTMWYSAGFTSHGLATIADTDSNGIEEALVLMIRDSDGRILVQGRNAAGNPAPIQYWFSP